MVVWLTTIVVPSCGSRPAPPRRPARGRACPHPRALGALPLGDHREGGFRAASPIDWCRYAGRELSPGKPDDPDVLRRADAIAVIPATPAARGPTRTLEQPRSNGVQSPERSVPV